MRIHIRTTPNTEPVPFDYQKSLVGAFHKWVGMNKLHDEMSLYSLSWLSGGKMRNGALHFAIGAHWQISMLDTTMMKKLIDGIQNDPGIDFGMEVSEVMIQEDPKFSRNMRFNVQSPVLIKRAVGERINFYLYDDLKADALLTETMKNKLAKSGKENLDVSISFDRGYRQAKTKLIDYRGIRIRGSVCPVIIKGDPEAIAVAWNVGVGNSTGIGFGALR